MEDHDPWEWFGKRTFRHNQFESLSKLREAKERLSTTVSVAIPARNEAATIGRIVRVLRKALLDRARLIDEIVVMDVHPRFVYGLIGPLLSDPGIGYVKAFYERPSRERNVRQRTGGGRVTELLARPVLNIFWPSLAGFVQPLSGEYAGRREVLEQVPFSSGYGVELGLLIDIATRFGLDSIAQVDLECRIHRNQDTQALSRMSFGILQAALARLAEEGRVGPESYSTTILYQFTKQLQEYHMQPHQIVTLERPPITTVDGYQRRREAVLAGRH